MVCIINWHDIFLPNLVKDNLEVGAVLVQIEHSFLDYTAFTRMASGISTAMNKLDLLNTIVQLYSKIAYELYPTKFVDNGFITFFYNT